ncbi:hypothetical protein [Alicyclobacillus sp. ALC3]|uniref:hypothetical protein n=1 Tax=Alicyclobacillus sp. ALC3 TaxID=2796143 RepID=UPI002379A0CB|nr:hypothetical protein [Alicyclobacillus sp. ALC3]WDL96854.1 hypothetical protein JC200_21620 [Alicyclobacillus sp. ALC3]
MQANQSINLTIQTISGNAGVYFGNQNISVGVSSHSKSNNAVGSVNGGSHFFKNLSVVYDPDVIDTPIDDRDVRIFAPQQTASNVLNAQIDGINIATVNQNAGVFIGETTITGFDSHEKDNYGFAPSYGNHIYSHANSSLVYDPDIVDALIDDRDVKSGVFVSAVPAQVAR